MCVSLYNVSHTPESTSLNHELFHFPSCLTIAALNGRPYATRDRMLVLQEQTWGPRVLLAGCCNAASHVSYVPSDDIIDTCENEWQQEGKDHTYLPDPRVSGSIPGPPMWEMLGYFSSSSSFSVSGFS
jgi:hypothetical protein